MDRLKGVAKGGWKPSHDVPIHRESWKSDLKGIATGKQKDPYEGARNHTSTPLSSLRDPDSFGAPPKHTGSFGSTESGPSTQGTLGSVVPTPSRRQQEAVEEEAPKPPPGPYRADTTGLRTDNLPKPPVRRGEGAAASPARTASPSLPPRQIPGYTPSLPPRQAAHPPPVLPPRMTENPTEYDPPPPPTYGEATRETAPTAIDHGAVSRLSQAGVSVPGFGIGAPSTPSPTSPGARGPQLSELQQRFSRMNTSNQAQPPPPASFTSAVAGKKAPPPPPPKKSALSGSRPSSSAGAPEPPPLPLASKPRPGG